MTSFKNFRNRGKDPRPDGEHGAANGDGRPADWPVHRRDHGPPSNATEMGPQHFEALRQIESEGEPLSLAEEVAELTDRGDLEKAAEALELLNKEGETHIAELQRMSMPQLLEEARKENLAEVSGMKRQELIFRILKERVKLNGL
ncbi:MAG TPA: Rho termination factor N-terminal domain-containing protein, partial [Pirellulaceae bacterium]|nr:Rho termination factor N-terminal domain-containing protein [Pirellulaceae bacterium]